MDWDSSSRPQSATPQPSDAQGGGLALLRSVGRGLLRLPRGVGALLTIGWMALIYWVSSLERIDGPRFLGRTGFTGNLAHAVEFGLLALWLVLALPRRDRWVELTPLRARLVFLFCTLFGALDEYHQLHVPNRSASLFDLLSDATGAACTVWIVAYVGRTSATRRGLSWRFLSGLVLCALAALASTAWDEWVGTSLWFGAAG